MTVSRKTNKTGRLFWRRPVPYSIGGVSRVPIEG